MNEPRTFAEDFASLREATADALWPIWRDLLEPPVSFVMRRRWLVAVLLAACFAVVALAAWAENDPWVLLLPAFPITVARSYVWSDPVPKGPNE